METDLMKTIRLEYVKLRETAQQHKKESDKVSLLWLTRLKTRLCLCLV